MVIAGIIGAGLMWGWLLVLWVDQRPSRARSQNKKEAENGRSHLKQYVNTFLEKWQTERRPYLNLLAVTIFTAWFAWVIYLMTNATLLIPFFIALLITFAIHFAWRQQLRRRQKSS